MTRYNKLETNANRHAITQLSTGQQISPTKSASEHNMYF